MNYYEVSFTLLPFSQQKAEILIALLAEIGFDSFIETDVGLLAYIPEINYNQKKLLLVKQNLSFKKTTISYQSNLIKSQNWNKKWESNFEPIGVENLCQIRAPFHKPQKGYLAEVIIEPKMAFGTGHHQTTWLMVRQIFDLEMEGKEVLDMGCGTGILSIVAEKLGAYRVIAIDNDNWAFQNSQENIAKNNCSKIDVHLGDSSILSGFQFDIILANINLNVLLKDLGKYAKCLKNRGKLIVSGILKADIPIMNDAAGKFNLKPFVQKNRDDWALIGFESILT